jgi:probable HAF family extracellular repeat protein
LPRLGGLDSVANDVNNHGQIVGWSALPNGLAKPFLIQANGTIQNLGSPVGATFATAEGINNLGEVVGSYALGGDRPFYWHSSTGRDELSRNLLPTKRYGSLYEMAAMAINDQGVIVGSASYTGSVTPDDDCHYRAATYWTDRSADPQSLPCVTQTMSPRIASDVSNSGWMAHSSLAARKGFRHAWQFNLGFAAPPVTGQTQGGVTLSGVNESGAVVGEFLFPTTDNIRHAYFWDGVSEKGRDLGAFTNGWYSKAAEVNDQNQNFVAGSSHEGTGADGYSPWRAFLWHFNFGLLKLPAPSAWQAPVSECYARALSDLRTEANGSKTLQVVGFCYRQGRQQAVSWIVGVVYTSNTPSG